MIVYIYGFKGIFIGDCEYEYEFPKEGVILTCVLFLLQEDDELNFESAMEECEKFGFSQIHELKGNPLKVESINLPSMKKFAGHYEEALETGSALAIYPTT